MPSHTVSEKKKGKAAAAKANKPVAVKNSDSGHKGRVKLMPKPPGKVL